jgi:hypothetical protein
LSAESCHENVPFKLAPFPVRRPATGWLLIAAGWAILLTPLVLIVALWLMIAVIYLSALAPPRPDERIFAVATVALVLGTLVAFPLAPYLLRRGRRLRAPSALELLRSDSRPPVLLLRSFQDEDLENPTPRLFYILGRQRYEEALARALSAIGPPISIGQPGEDQPELGAARLYVSVNDWQPAVLHFMRHARLVVIIVGRSSGVWWEIAGAARNVVLHRLLFFFPHVEEGRARRSFWRWLYLYFRATGTTRQQLPLMHAEKEQRYANFRARGGELLGVPLPETMGDTHFLAFSRAGEPRLLTTMRPWNWMLLRRQWVRTHIDFRKTLQPHFNEWVTPDHK